MKYLIICSSQRTGSTLIASLLLRSGFATGGHEFFEAGHVMPDTVLPALGMASVADAEANLDDYVERIKARWPPRADQFLTIKLHWHHFEYWRRKGLDLARHFPGARYLFCSRGDHVAQAISALKANQSGTWTSAAGAKREPQYNFDHLCGQMEYLIYEHGSWEQYFAGQRIHPFRLAYESLDQDYRAVLRHVDAWLGLGLTRRQLWWLRPGSTRQRDVVNQEWQDRYYRDLGGFGALPA